MSNSSLVSYTQISPNRTSPRNNVIDTITIHCVVGQVSVEGLGSIFSSTSAQASSNYGIGYDGKIGMYVEECDRSWCSSNAANDNRAITIEVASDTTNPYAVTDAAYDALIELCADICQRNGIAELKWRADSSLIGQTDKQNMTVHRWFAQKSCPGDYLYNLHYDIAEKVNAKLRGEVEVEYTEKSVSWQGTVGSVILDVYEKPSVDSDCVGKYTKGDVLQICAKTDNGWYKVKNSGYVYGANIKDNSPDSWAKTVVDFAVDNKILLGDGNDNYKLHDTCTRQEMLVFIYRYYNLIKNK